MGLRRGMTGGLVAAGLLAALAPGAQAQTARGQTVRVVLHHAEILKVPDYSWMQIGDPTIADVQKRQNGMLVIFGYQLGTTNLLAYDSSGRRILDREIVVVPDNATPVTITRQTTATSYLCEPDCIAVSIQPSGAATPAASSSGAGPGSPGQALPGTAASAGAVPNAVNPLQAPQAGAPASTR